MAYTNVWLDTSPTGAEAANTIDDIFRSMKVDIEQRFIDIFNMANFTADPLRPGGLKFYDTADAKLFFGNNAGTPWAINLRDKADTTTYTSLKYTGIVLTPPTLTGASTPFFQVTQTWNNGATTFVGMLVNVTSTASAAASLLFDWQVAGVTKWKIDKTGTATLSNTGYALLNLNGAAGFGAQIFMGEATGGYKAAIMYNVNVGNGLEFYANGTAIGNKIGFWSATALAVTGNLSATGSLAVAATSKFYLDGVNAAGDTYIQESAANQMDLIVGGALHLRLTTTYTYVDNGDFIINTTNKVRVDGSPVGDTYIYESSANVLRFVVGGVNGIVAIDQPTGIINVQTVHLSIDPTKRFYLDAGIDTYITESSSNIILFVNGGASNFRIISDGAGVFSLSKMYLDGGSDTYIYEASANRMELWAGGVRGISVLATVIGIGAGLNFNIEPTQKFFLDGGGDTYITEVSANNIRTVVGGVVATTTTAALFALDSAIDFIIQSAKKLYLDGGGDTYLYEDTGNRITIFTGGSAAMGISLSGMYIPSAAKLWLDGGGDTYLYEASANNVQIVTGATPVFGVFTSGAYVISGLKLFLDSGSNTYLIESSADVISVFAGALSVAEFGNNAGTKYLRAPYMTPQGVFGTLYDGCIVVDSATPGQFVYFANGARYKVVGTSF